MQFSRKNPGRLFKFDDNDTGDHLAEYLIKSLPTHAADGLKANRADTGVLIGQTLRDAVLTTLRQVASNAAGAKAHLSGDRIIELVKAISERVAVKREDVGLPDLGSKEWLAIYRSLLARALTTGEIPKLIGDDNKPTPEGEALIKKLLAA